MNTNRQEIKERTKEEYTTGRRQGKRRQGKRRKEVHSDPDCKL
jgi:DNA invertase Pin-like site-specific DNA recombinase